MPIGGAERAVFSYVGSIRPAMERVVDKRMRTRWPTRLATVTVISRHPSLGVRYDKTRHQYYSFTDIKNISNHTPSRNILPVNVIFENQLKLK